MFREIPLPSGKSMSPFACAFMIQHHMTYHDAQLNFIQSLHGDMAVHWEG